MNNVLPMTGRFDPERNSLHAHVRQYIQAGFAILPIWWIADGKCGCGDTRCNSPGKHPIGALAPKGVKNATSDLAIATAWWAQFPTANIGLALGRVSGYVAIDVDGPQAQELLDKIFTIYNIPFVQTWRVETGREDGGYHLYYRYPDSISVPNHKMQGLEIRSDKVYVVAPPSIHYTGRVYTWGKSSQPAAELPECLIDYANNKLFKKKPVLISEGTGKRRMLSDNLDLRVPPAYTEFEANRINTALKYIPANCDYETWLGIGMSLHWTGWGERAFEIWVDWSKGAPEIFQPGKPRKTLG